MSQWYQLKKERIRKLYIENTTDRVPTEIQKHNSMIFPYSPVENKNDLELDFKVFFFTDSCCSDIVDDESK